ncbi:hypothetical protein [Burkholderia sp. BCC1999]|uniref:hypothetical protein n=1 Tax=Burkholderia sp. BCC1999 TaxID=2817448 RepID=UPI002AC31B9F|nr:hypothetical protein [Burkholderia sp. BCC1999]
MPHTIEPAAGLGGAIRAARPVQMTKWCQNVTTDRAGTGASRASGKETAHD